MRLMGLLLVGVALAAEPRFDDVFDPTKFPEGGERKEAREKAFEEAVKAHGPGAALHAFRKAEAAVEKLRARTDADYATYRKYFDQWWAWRRQFEADYWKKYGKPPAEYPTPTGLNRAYLDQEIVFHVSRSLLLQERSFHEWALERTAALLRESPDGKAVAKGLTDRSPEQRLRCARLADPATAAAAARREDHPGVLAALAEVAPGECMWSGCWPVDAGAIRGARKLGTREAAGWLVARMETKEGPPLEGRLRDDLLDALEKMSGKDDVGYDAAAWRAWLDALPADWKAKGGGAGEGKPGRFDEPKVPGTASAGPATFLGISSGTEAAVYCVQASVAWEKVRAEVLSSVASLPPGSVFGVVAYDSTAHRFKTSLVEQNRTNREALGKWLEKLEPDHGADPYAGMMAALDLAEGKGAEPAADTIFLLALTKPPDGTLFDDPRQVMQEILARNALLGIRIHCVGPSDGGESYYLQHLANQFGGFHVNG